MQTIYNLGHDPVFLHDMKRPAKGSIATALSGIGKHFGSRIEKGNSTLIRVLPQ